MKKIAIEEGLSNVKDYLVQQGLQVETLKSHNKDNRARMNQFDAIVISSMENNVMGIENTYTKTPIVDASGLTPDDVYKQIINKK